MRIFTPLRCWVGLLVAMLPLPVVWALSNPLFAAPDEPAHMVRAQGAIRGDFQQPYTTDGLPLTAVNCLMFRSGMTADCIDLAWGPAGLEQRSTAQGYPPLFHALAGVPALFLSGPVAAYAMRLWLALLSCTLLAWAAVLLWTRRPDAWSLASVFLAATPMVVFTMATVNPSGLTAACAALIWAAGINVTRPTSGTLPRASAVTLVLTLSLFALVRRDALGWELVMALILAATTLTRDRVWTLLRRCTTLAGLALVAAATILTWWIWVAPAIAEFVAGSVDRGGTWASGLAALPGHLRELVGLFGWVDSPVTSETVVVATATLAAVLALGIARGSRPEAWAAASTLVVMCVVSVVVDTIRYPYLQGRYLFPAFIGAVLMASQAIAGAEPPPRHSRRLLRAAVTAIAAVQFLAFAQNLRRYAVGASGSWLSIADAPWHPPMMSNGTSLILAAAAIAVALGVTRTLPRPAPISAKSEKGAA